MLYKLNTNIFIIGILTFGFMTALAVGKAMYLMTLVPLLSFITQMGLLLYFSREDKVNYSDKILFCSVFIYTLFLGIFFLFISEYYDGDNFLFSKADAMVYYTESMKVQDLGLINAITRIIQEFPYDDWGAFIFDTIAMYIIPSKLFLNFINILLGAVAAVFLYRMGKPYMPEPYAFLAAMAYATSSYVVFFHCSFLKESTFVFFVICTLYSMHLVIDHQSRKALFAVAICIVIHFFFRPAVAAFIAIAIFVYYGVYLKGYALSLFLYVAAIGVFLAAIPMAMEVIDSNTSGGNIDAVIEDSNNAAYSSSFNYFVSFFGAFFGPFPTLFSQLPKPVSIQYLGAGLIYKLFLILPFWFGIFTIIKEKIIGLFPVTIFVILELVLTGAVCASLEVRKVILHIPFMYLITFYGMSKGYLPHQITHISSLPCYLFTVAILLVWNVIRVKTSY